MAKKKWLFPLRIVLFLAVFALLERGFCFLVTPPNFYNTYDVEQDARAQNRTIDMVFMGSSTTYCSFNPQIFDETLGVNSFNFGSSSVAEKDLYYYLKNILAEQPVKTVILGVSAGRLMHDSNITKSLIVFDRLHGFGAKAELLFHSFEPSQYFNVLLRSTNFKDSFNWQTIRDNVSLRLSKEYRDGTYRSDGFYAGKGFQACEAKVEDGGWGNTTAKAGGLSLSKIDPEALDYLDKTIAMCRKEGIDVLFVYPPMPNALICKMNSYQVTHNYFADLAQQYGLDFYDFNYSKTKIHDFPDSCFYDRVHLSEKGAAIFSAEIAEILLKRRNGEDVSDYFFNLYGEYEAALDYVPGVEMKVQDNKDGSFTFTATPHRPVNMPVEYRFLWKKLEEPDSAYEEIQSYCLDARVCELGMLPEGGFVMRAEVRVAGAVNDFDAFCTREFTVYPPDAQPVLEDEEVVEEMESLAD